ncbi:SPOR domain-containing protein [Methylocapsa palsarum]|uniref:Sporulation related domain-containing protein n=1 Tax=Methylocapsa palsarum TaxID=1612308 RepID=A0A1I3Y7E0_9HYPH|nr:SPOR domain-containing protein [Methylocapsa palsarum]SFK27784.1 Sporulation related domain-containing protein [Methylocapsa palsarum]
MAEPVVKRRPMIDLDEFERRLRQPGSGEHKDTDPLSELARLVGPQEDPYKGVFAAQGRRPVQSWDERSHDANGRDPLMGGDFAAIEAGLLGAAGRDAAMGYSEPGRASEYHSPDLHEPHEFHDTADEPGHWDYADALEAPQFPAEGPDEEERSRRPLYLMAAIIVAGISVIAASFVIKGGVTAPTEVATIKAASGPAKIQPEAAPGGEVPVQDASIIDRSSQSSAVALVNNAEQPVDLSQAPEKTARVITLNGAKGQYNALPPGAAGVPVANAQPQSAPRSDGDLSIAGLIEPKKVKTVSVRPDGTLLPNARPAPIQATPPGAAHAPAPPVKAATPKTTARVTMTPKPAEAEAAQPAQRARPVQVADAQAEANQAQSSPVGAGTYAVQLAAPESEQEARDVQIRLMKKFGGELAGFHPSIHKAASGSKTVYRVRVGNLSKEGATALCQKIQGGGGACFVAKN